MSLSDCLPTFLCGVRKSGIAMEMYSCQKYFAWVPFIVVAILLNLDNQSCPSARVAAPCAFQVSLLSTVTPKNLTVSFDGIHWLSKTSACQGMGILFFRLKGGG